MASKMAPMASNDSQPEVSLASTMPYNKDLKGCQLAGYVTLKDATTGILSHLCSKHVGQFTNDSKLTGSKRSVYRCFSAFQRKKGTKAVWIDNTTVIACERGENESNVSYTRRVNQLREKQNIEGLCRAKIVFRRRKDRKTKKVSWECTEYEPHSKGCMVQPKATGRVLINLARPSVQANPNQVSLLAYTSPSIFCTFIFCTFHVVG